MTGRKPITVEVEDCKFDVELDLNVFLEGVVQPGPVMTTYLQGPSIYPGFIPAGVLPVQNPYTGRPEFYHQINDTLGPAGKVVDWILVEIMANFKDTLISFLTYTLYDLVESQALLLKPDGTVVDTNAQSPHFRYYTEGDVRIAVKHRNHLSVLSSALLSFNSNLSYHFSEDAGKALKISWVPYQPMSFKNGKWCLWAGDIWNGLPVDLTRDVINNTDADRFYIPLKRDTGYTMGDYLFEDVNMDGIIDELGDGGPFIIPNGRQNTQSPLLFYIKRP